MKKLFISMLAVAALASCSQEDVIVADKGDLIGFNSFVENSTRATDPSYSNKDIAKFNVYGTVNGVLIYPGTEITKGTAAYGSAWTCPVDQYWIANADYKFVGIVDGEVAGVTKTNLVNGMPTSVEYTADGKTDLLCQTITRKNDTSIVKFNFSHLLSKVNFTVVNGTPNEDGYSFVVKNINFAGNVAGVYNVADAAWDADKFTTDDTALGNTVDGSADKNIVVASKAASAELAKEVLFLPGEYTISFTVDILYNGKPVTTTNYPATGTTYKHKLDANNSYNFKVNVAVGQLIEFSVEKQPTWTTPSNTVELK
jgi:hypothetical protein